MNWIKRKKTQETVKSKSVSPNNKLYIALLLVAIALTIPSISISSCNTAFTIWSSITCGGIASIVVAWLIDIANCKITNKKALENRETLFANLYRTFDTGIQLLVLECAEIDCCRDSKKWFEWIELAKKQATNDATLIPSYIRPLMVFFDDIAEQVFAIKSQEATLLETGIICQEDIQSLSTILGVCDISRTTLQSKDSDYDRFQKLITYCRLLQNLIDYAPSLRRINKMKIDPKLYNMCLEAEETKQASEINQNPLVPTPKQAKTETE